MRIAGIDIGSNTVRLLIADVETHQDKNSRPIFYKIYEDRRITRLGEGIGVSGRLAPSAIDKTISALKDFSAACDRYRIQVG